LAGDVVAEEAASGSAEPLGSASEPVDDARSPRA
jgi:hypothetical protein